MYYELLQLDRNYQALTKLLVTCKVHFKEKFDILFPRFEEHFGNVYLTYFLNLLEAYPHPELIHRKRCDAIKRRLIEGGLQSSRAHRCGIERLLSELRFWNFSRFDATRMSEIASSNR